MLIPEGNSYKFLGAYDSWSTGDEKTYMITSYYHYNGYNFLNPPYVWTDDLEVTEDGDILWYDAGYFPHLIITSTLMVSDIWFRLAGLI